MNVVVFCIDTLRKDHLPTFGYDRATAPNVDRFAQEAVVCEEAIAPSTFTFSVASSLLSGLPAAAHGALSFEDRLDDDVVTLPELAAESGAATGVFAGMNYFSPEWGLARGFDRNYQPDEQDETSTVDRLLDEFFDWVDATEGLDRFSIVWSFDAHLPYVTTADTFDGHPNPAIDPYDNAIRYVDEQFDRLVEGLRARGEYDETLLIVLADHGEVFDEHHWMESSRLARMLYDWNVPVLHDLLHEDQLGHVAIPPYEPVIDVPLLLKFPGQSDQVDAGATVQTHDLAPTIGATLGLQEPADQWQGEPLHRLRDRPAEEFRRHAFVTTAQTPGGSTYRAARTSRQKAITLTDPSWENDTVKFYLGRRFLSSKRQAFQLGERFGEECRVPVDDGFSRLFETLSDHVERCDEIRQHTGTESTSLSAAKRQQLEQMGYL